MLENIVDYTLSSLNEYTNQSLHNIVNIMINDGFATKKESEKEDKIYIGSMAVKSSLSLCIGKQNMAIKSIEKWEFDKNYRYSMLFCINKIEENIFKMPIESGEMVWYDSINEFEELYKAAMNPSLKKVGDNFYLKFNYRLDGTDVFGEQLKKRYSILAIFYVHEQILELRFDTIEQVFMRKRFIYVYDVLSWIRRYLNISITKFDFGEIVEYIKSNGKSDKVVISGQDMRMATGGRATVEVGNNDEMVLPFIGELKILINNYKEEFDKVPVLKQAFIEFIYEKENLSEFPWIRFKFEENNFEVKFTFDYGDECACLLQHYHSVLKANQGRERMDYVTNYIVKVRNIIKELPVKQE